MVVRTGLSRRVTPAMTPPTVSKSMSLAKTMIAEPAGSGVTVTGPLNALRRPCAVDESCAMVWLMTCDIATTSAAGGIFTTRTCPGWAGSCVDS